MMADDDLRHDSEGLGREPASESWWQEQLEKGTAGCKNSVFVPGRGCRRKGGWLWAPCPQQTHTAALAALILLLHFSDPPGNCWGVFQQSLAPASSGSRAAWLAFRSTNGARGFLAVLPHEMAQTPRFFSKRDGASPNRLNLVENLSALTLLLQMQQSTTRGEHWGWGEKNEKFCRLWCKDALPKPPVFGC